MRDIFGSERAFSAFEETVKVSLSKDDADGIRRVGSVRATVICGADLNQSAGASVHAETADRTTVVIRRVEWMSAFTIPPRFGVRFTLEKFGEVIVKAVQEGEGEFVCRCTRRQKARES